MKKIISVFLTIITVFSLAACSGKKEEVKSANIFVLTGPTGIGAVNLWNKSENAKSDVKYNFTAVASPDEIVAKLSNGEADIAAVPTNLAAKLYKKTQKGIKILAVNTLGVLSVLDNTGAKINSLSDLKGRKIVTTGQGANPQYIIEYLLRKSNIDITKDVTVEYKTDGSQLASVWSSEPNAVIIAPAPVSTSVLLKFKTANKVLDLTDEWDKLSENSSLMMGCIIARKDFCENSPETVNKFLEEYENSAKEANSNPETTGTLCEKYGIVTKAAVAQKAIPDCHICFISGNEMKTKLSGYLKVLYDIDKSSVGEIPDEGFWYEKQ